MQLSNFDYTLPNELIAQTPIEPRDNSRLLILDPKSEKISEWKFSQIADYLNENDVLVLNETKVINARLFGKMAIFPKWVKKVKEIEILLHKQISLDTWEILWPWNNLKIGRKVRFEKKVENEIIAKHCHPELVSEWHSLREWTTLLEWEIIQISRMWRLMKFNKSWVELLKVIEEIWEIPLPPYIHENLQDKSRYQTIFAKVPWSAAAPTASLHFTDELLEKLARKWVKLEKVLLHVWVGTFKPVEVENIEEHYMHSEYIEISKEVAERLNQYKLEGKRIIAVWTTAARLLESFAILEENNDLWYFNDMEWHNYFLSHWAKETDIFIYPWYEWKFIDSMITNFHLPKSTLLMLVSSFAGVEFTKKAYKYAIKNKFRFFSFGDVMWIKKRKP